MQCKQCAIVQRNGTHGKNKMNCLSESRKVKWRMCVLFISQTKIGERYGVILSVTNLVRRMCDWIVFSFDVVCERMIRKCASTHLVFHLDLKWILSHTRHASQTARVCVCVYLYLLRISHVGLIAYFITCAPRYDLCNCACKGLYSSFLF